jgi:hypothetical protein
MTTLDAWSDDAGISAIDVLKLDTQGSELGVLRGARRRLRTARALEVEVEFNPIYQGQPLFGDVDRFLRRRGFLLWRLGNLVHYGLAGARADFPAPECHYFDSEPRPIAASGGQLSWGHAYYIHHDLTRPESATDFRSCLRDACVASALGYRDLAGLWLRQAHWLAPDSLRPRILAAVAT